jgi:nicotinamide riboside kinase
MPKLIVTGPESSGKTTLCEQLSDHFKIPFAKEFAREFLENLGREYTQDDLLEIAKGQLKNETPLPGGVIGRLNQQPSLHDTDLITIKIWSEYKYGKCEKWILEQIEIQKSETRIYLLCKPDIPWEAHPQRENPNNRDELFEIYKTELGGLGYTYFVVEGSERNLKTTKYLKDILSNC